MKFITYKDYLEYAKQKCNMSLAEESEKYILDTKISKQVQIKENPKEAPYEYSINEEIVDNKHDKMFRSILSDKKEMVNFLNQFLNLHDKIEVENLQQCNTNFITKKFKEKRSDIIYRLKDKPIYFLVEHQSTIDKNMPHRLYEYVGEIIKSEAIIQHTYLPKDLYPVVVPIVIYTGFRKWKIDTNFSKKQFLVNFYERYQIDMEYNLIAVQDYTFEELLGKKTLFSSIMIIEKCKTKEELNEYMDKIIDKIKETKDKEKLLEIIVNIIKPMVGEKSANRMLEKISKESEGENMSPVQKMLFDLKKEALKEGREEGREKGREEGREEGKVEGIKEGIKEGITKVVKGMLKFGEQDEKIVKYTGISKKELEDIKKIILVD